MNRGEQIEREIIEMDKKHTWKCLSTVAASPQAKKKKRISSENLFFQKNSPFCSFLPKQRNPSLENLCLRKTHSPVLALFAFRPSKNEDPLLQKNLPASFPLTCSLLLA